jgi:hypothetical protein
VLKYAFYDREHILLKAEGRYGSPKVELPMFLQILKGRRIQLTYPEKNTQTFWRNELNMLRSVTGGKSSVCCWEDEAGEIGRIIFHPKFRVNSTMAGILLPFAKRVEKLHESSWRAVDPIILITTLVMLFIP